MRSPSRRSVLYAGFAVPLLGACAGWSRGVAGKQISVAAPFDMPSITVPEFKDAPRFVISQYWGSVGLRVS